MSLPGPQLVSPGGVGWAVFLCGPMAGFLLLARNDGVLGRRLGGWGMVLAGLVFSFLEGCLFALIPEPETRLSTATLGVVLFNLFVLLGTAAVLHGGVKGRRRVPTSAVVIRGLLGVLIFLGLAFGGEWVVASLRGDGYSTVTIAPGKTVHHTDACTPQQARALGDALVNERIFGGPGEQAARLDRDGTTYVVTFWIAKDGPVRDQGLQDEERRFYRLLALKLSEGVFQNARARVELRDAESSTRVLLKADSEDGKRLRDADQVEP